MADPAHPESESLRLELQEAIASYRLLSSSVTQVAGFLAAADAALIAYGFAQLVSGILLVASAMPLILVVAYVEILQSTLPVIYVAMTLEQKLQLHDAPLTRIYVKSYTRGVFADLAEYADMTDENIRESILGSTRRRWLTTSIIYILYAIFIAQIALFLIGLLLYHYRFM